MHMAEAGDRSCLRSYEYDIDPGQHVSIRSFVLCGQYVAITLAYLQLHVFTGIQEVMQQSWLHGGTLVHGARCWE